MKAFIRQFHHDKLLRELDYVDKKISERELKLADSPPVYRDHHIPDEFMFKLNKKGDVKPNKDNIIIHEQVRNKLNLYKVEQRSSVIGRVVLNA